jgi:hypothetical protein
MTLDKDDRTGAAIAYDAGIGVAYRTLQIAFYTGSELATAWAFAPRDYHPVTFQGGAT